MKRTIFKLLRGAFSVLGWLVVLVALIVLEENYRGKRAWESYKRDAVARGLKLDLNGFIPPPVPDDQNFAMTPLLKPLFGKDREYSAQLDKRIRLPEPKEGKTMPSLGNRLTEKRFNLEEWSEYLGDPDVLHALKRFDSEMAEISAASRRPYSRLPLPYEKGSQMSLGCMGQLWKFSMLFATRGLTHLRQGHPSQACDDCETVLHLADATKCRELVISALFRYSLLSRCENVIWQGLSVHQWSEEQLSALQADLQDINLVEDGLTTSRGEMSWGAWLIEGGMNGDSNFCNLGIQESMPRAWFYQNMLTGCRFYEQEVFPAFDPLMRRIRPEKIKSVGMRPAHFRFFRNPYTVLADMAHEAVCNFVRECAYSQATVDEATIACALERYRLIHNDYPETLNALVPQYFSQLPHDVMTGEPLHYNRTSDGRFILYSVGWNETDDHGTVATKKDSSNQDTSNGDWVWRQ